MAPSTAKQKPPTPKSLKAAPSDPSTRRKRTETSEAADAPKQQSSLSPGVDWRRNSLLNAAALVTANDAASRRESSCTSTSFNPTIPELAKLANQESPKGLRPVVVSDEDDAELSDDAKKLHEQRKMQEHALHHANVHRQHQDDLRILHRMRRRAKGDENILKQFISWAAATETDWKNFFSQFRSDGTMTRKEFERYVHYNQKWQGPTEEVFELIEEDECGFIRNSRCLELKRWWRKCQDAHEIGSMEFKKRLAKHYGSLALAWRNALDKENTGKCCFLKFCRVCQDAGIKKHLKTIWSEITEGTERCINYRDLDPEGDMVIQMFATSLTLHGGTLIKGWQSIIRESGGHMHRAAFIDHCNEWGIALQPAQWLFALLDPHRMRYLTEYDDLEFLSLYDPGPLSLDAASPVFRRTVSGSGSAKRPFYIKEIADLDQDGETADDKSDRAFNLVVVLTAEEHSTYRDKLRSKMMMQGIDMPSKTRESTSGSPRQPRSQMSTPPISPGAPLAVGWTSKKHEAKTTPEAWLAHSGP